MRDARHRFPFAASLASVLLAFASCRKAPPPDPLCKDEPLPGSARVGPDQGAIQISAPGNDYFYVVDPNGKEVGHAKVGGSVAVKAGPYQVRLNGSLHSTWAKTKTLTRCAGGALFVSGTTDEYYYFVDSGGTELAHAKVGTPLAFFPGRYDVKLNKTTQPAEVPSGSALEIKSGTLLVRGTTDEYYYVLSGTGAELAHNKLERPLAFFPGPLTVKVNCTTAPVQVTAAAVGEVRTGALNLRGTTDEYYYVLSGTGTELAHNKLGQPLSFVEGSYTIKVNNISMAAKVDAGKSNEYATGTLTVKGNGTDYYYVLDGVTETELAHAKTGLQVALAAGKYSVRLNKETRPAVVTEGQATVVSW
jgi:mannose-6-phosphate isomerase-like protein (cupin superfamily)